MNSVTTPNMLEIAYLLDRRHRITGVTTRSGWPYGIEELSVTLSGEGIELDHLSFMRHGEIKDLSSLAGAFAAVQAAIARKTEDGAFGGRL